MNQCCAVEYDRTVEYCKVGHELGVVLWCLLLICSVSMSVVLFQVFRLVDAADGTVDGKYGVA